MFQLALQRIIFLVCFGTILAIISGIQVGDPEIRRFTIVHSDLPSIKLAILADFHFATARDLEILSVLGKQLKNENPDLILFLGDYIDQPSFEDSLEFRKSIISGLSSLSHYVPAFAVLGNHEHWDSSRLWKELFDKSTVRLLVNEIGHIELRNQLICIRGLDDWYTSKWDYVSIPDYCEGRVITITHDPAGLLAPKGDVFPTEDWLNSGELESLSFAGHTHCGQIRLPFFGAPIVPSISPKEMHCGMYKRGKIGITSVGLGTSVFPLRFGSETHSGWELVEIH